MSLSIVGIKVSFTNLRFYVLQSNQGMGLGITAAVWRLAGAIKDTLAAGEDPYDGEALMSHLFNTEWLNRKFFTTVTLVNK